jgi:hypothetical protein
VHLILWNVGCNQFSVSIRNGKSAKDSAEAQSDAIGGRPAANGGQGGGHFPTPDFRHVQEQTIERSRSVNEIRNRIYPECISTR